MAGIHFVGPDKLFCLSHSSCLTGRKRVQESLVGLGLHLTLSDVLLKVKAQQNTVPEIL